MTEAFKPLPGSGRQVNVSATSTSLALPSVGGSIYLANVGSNIAYTRFGTVSAITALGSDFPLPVGSIQVVGRDTLRDLYMAAVTDTGLTTTLKICSGSGE